MQTENQQFQKADTFQKIIGYGIISAVVFMLVYCERGVRGVSKAADYMAANYAELTDTTEVLPENDGKMVYFSAFEQTDEDIADPTYGVGGHYLSIHRLVLYYQWVEIAETTTHKYKDETEENTEYSYAKGWVKEPVYSKSFYDSRRHVNKAPLVIPSVTTRAKEIKMGPYALGDVILKHVTDQQTKTLNHGVDMATASKVLDHAEEPMKVHLLSKEIYYGEDPAHPAIGDVRVSFVVAKPQFMYIFAMADKDTLVPYHVAELSEDKFKLSARPIDTSKYRHYDKEGGGYLILVGYVIAWLCLVWAVYELKGTIVEKFRKSRLFGRFVPQKDNKGTLWVVGTYLALIVIVVCHLLSAITS